MCLRIVIETEKMGPDEAERLHQLGKEKCGLYFDFIQNDQKEFTGSLSLRSLGEGCGCEMSADGADSRDELWKFHEDYIPKIEAAISLLMTDDRKTLIFEPYWIQWWYEFDNEEDDDENEDEDDGLPEVDIELGALLEELRGGNLKTRRRYVVRKESE